MYTAALPVAVAGEVDEVKDDSQELSKKTNLKHEYPSIFTLIQPLYILF